MAPDSTTPTTALVSPDPAPWWARPLPQAVALLVLVLLVYGAHVVQAQLLNFDDNLLLGPDNGRFVAGGWLGLLDPHRPIANAFLPVAHLSLYLDLQLAGGDAGAVSSLAHGHSLLIHWLAAVALGWWLRSAGLRAGTALGAAALFAVHPALVESVGWVAGRKDVLSGLFTFLCLGVLARHARGGQGAAVWLAPVLALLAMYAKATAVVLPLLGLATLLWIRPPERSRSGLQRFLPLGLVALVVALVGAHHHTIAAAEGVMASVPTGSGATVGERLVQVPGVLAFYLQKALLPFGLNVMHPAAEAFQLFRDRFWLGLILCGLWVGAIGWAGWRGRRDWRFCAVATGLAVAALALLPFNTAWPASSIAVADRYLYLAVPGFALAAAALLGRYTLLPVAILAVLALLRTSDFRTSEALWRASLAASGGGDSSTGNAVAELNLALTLLRRNLDDTAEAEALLRAAAEHSGVPAQEIRAWSSLEVIATQAGDLRAAADHALAAVAAARRLPDSPAARQARVDVLDRAHLRLRLARRNEVAKELLEEAVALDPTHPGVLASRANALLEDAVLSDDPAQAIQRLWPEAEPLLGAALAESPPAADAEAGGVDQFAGARVGHRYKAHLVAARWASVRSQPLQAVRHYLNAIKLQPDVALAYAELAQHHLQNGHARSAEKAARDGLKRAPKDPSLVQGLGLSLAAQQDWRGARQHLEAYLRIWPGDKDVARVLANVLATQAVVSMSQRSPEEVRGLAERARTLDPTQRRVDWVLGKLALDAGEFEVAIGHLNTALSAYPGKEDIRRLLAEAHRGAGWEARLHSDTPDEAWDHWRRFLDLATPEMDEGPIRNMLTTAAERKAEEGLALLQGRNAEDAEAAFRRARDLMPEAQLATLPLGIAILQQYPDPSQLREALDLFRLAAGELRDRNLDPGIALLWQGRTLKALGQSEAVARLVQGWLDAPGEKDSQLEEQMRALLD